MSLPVSSLGLIAVLATATHAQVPVTAGDWSPAALRSDMQRLRKLVAEDDRSYGADARRQALARLDALEGAVDTIGQVRFELEVARIIALADNGHTTLPSAMRAARYNRVGLRLAPFGDQFHVLRAREADQDLLGARVTAIEGKAIDQVRHIAHPLTGGAANWRDRFVPNFIESPEQMFALGVIPARDRATYTFELPDGRQVTRTLVAEPAPPLTTPRIPSGRWMYPDTSVSDGSTWRGLLDPTRAPWSLQDASSRFRFRRAPELDGVVIELRQNNTSPGWDIRRFLSTISESLEVIRPVHVVLDLRMNGGGDLNTTRAFVQRLPALASGRIFVLTSPYTFSAAISTVGYLEQAAPDRVTIAGEQVGDRMEFWAEGLPITLEKTGIRIGLARERHDYATGCRPYKDCHGSVVRNPIALPSLAPEVAAPWTIDAYRAGRDPGMEAVLRVLGKRG